MSGEQFDLGHIAVMQEEMWMYLDCDRCGQRLCQIEANDTMDILANVGHDHLAGCKGNNEPQEEEQ